MKKSPAKSRKKTIHHKTPKKSNGLFTTSRDFFLFTASIVVISVCVFYLFNLFQF